MTEAQTLHARTLASALSRRSLAETWRALRERYRVHRARRTAVAVLRALDDRMLRDIGINRSEIESVVYGEPRAEVSGRRRAMCTRLSSRNSA